MGCFDFNCSVSGLPFGWEAPVRFIILAQNKTARCRGAHDVEGAWRLLAPPMRARYNHYGSIEYDESKEADVLFDVLNRRAVERAAGENGRFEPPVTRGMPREDWLSALWLGRVQIETPQGRAEVAQTMVREDVWLYLAENSGTTTNEPLPWRFIDGNMRLETAFDTQVIRDPALEGTLRELYSVTHGLKRLGRPWVPGTSAGICGMTAAESPHSSQSRTSMSRSTTLSSPTSLYV